MSTTFNEVIKVIFDKADKMITTKINDSNYHDVVANFTLLIRKWKWIRTNIKFHNNSKNENKPFSFYDLSHRMINDVITILPFELKRLFKSILKNNNLINFIFTGIRDFDCDNLVDYNYIFENINEPIKISKYECDIIINEFTKNKILKTSHLEGQKIINIGLLLLLNDEKILTFIDTKIYELEGKLQGKTNNIMYYIPPPPGLPEQSKELLESPGLLQQTQELLRQREQQQVWPEMVQQQDFLKMHIDFMQTQSKNFLEEELKKIDLTFPLELYNDPIYDGDYSDLESYSKHCMIQQEKLNAILNKTINKIQYYWNIQMYIQYSLHV